MRARISTDFSVLIASSMWTSISCRDGPNSSWAVCISYVDGGERPASSKSSKVDYRAVLSKDDFVLFSRLRELRKRLAAEDGVPIYAVFTNEQLAAMARNRSSSLEELAAIEGIGRARVERHGEAFLALIKEPLPLLEQPQPNGDLHGA